MKTGAVVLGLLLCATTVFSGQITITSLPYSINQGQHSRDAIDTITIAGTRLTSQTDGIRFNPEYHNPISGWLLNLVSDTIEFAAGGGSNNEGIAVMSQADYPAHNLTINGGWIICKSPRDNDTNSSNNTCMIFGGEDILLKNVNMVAGGYDGKCVVGSGYDFEISGGQYLSRVNYYHSRCQFDAIIMNFSQVVYDEDYALAQSHTCNIKIHDIKITNAPHAGIRVASTTGSLTDYAVVKIYNNDINIDARNFRYTSYSGTCASSANPFGIALQRVGPGSEIYNNKITSGTSFGGGRGILLETARGSSRSFVEVFNNYVDTHEGPNSEYDENHAEFHAVRMRNDCSYLHFHNNTVIGTGDNSTATSSYGKSISAVRYTFDGTYGGTNSYNIIENNVFRVKSLNAGVTAYAVCFDQVDIPDTTMTFRYNRLESDNILVKFGELNGGARGITLHGDTLRFLSPSYEPETFHVGQFCNDFNSSRNFARDEVYQNGASDTNIVISCTTRGQNELGIQRLLRVKVLGNNGYPVTGAALTVTNNYRKSVVSSLTAGNGIVSGPATYWWESGTSSDSTAYNNFTIKAKKGTDSTIVSTRLTATSAIQTITLLKTAGDSSANCDTCGVICGDINDDGSVNVIDVAYLIKYLYRNGEAPYSMVAADVDRDGVLNMLDAAYIINAQYRGGGDLRCW
ncbi:exported hypothetical protein [Candidatus Zixiibacteriota bacterium]|nr:exported hypothetical protein [candidate division Zixibacteria bacterium]